MAQQTKNQETVGLTDSLFSAWNTSLERALNARKEADALILQALESQKETFEKATTDLSKIEDEQKKLVEDLRESIIANIEKTFGQTAKKAYEQYLGQFDEVSNRLQQLSATPYKEAVNLLNQSYEQFQASVKSGIEQQGKYYDELANTVKSSQQAFVDLYENNAKIAFGLFK